MAKTISINFLENSIVIENQQEAENKATLLTVDFTGAGVDTWAKWVDYKAADGTGMPVSLGLSVVATHAIPAAVLKKGMLFIQAYAMDGEYVVKGKVFGIQVNPSLNITTNTTDYDPTLLETFQQVLSDMEMQIDEVYDAYVAGAFDGDSAYDVAVSNGFIGTELQWLASLNGADGAQLTSVAFVGNDMVFTKDDATTVSLIGAKLTLKGDTGATGATGASIISASFVGNDLVFVKSDASTVTIVNGKLTLKGDTGATGAQGIPGNDGLDGESAYEVAVLNGFVGTEAEWLLSLKGEQGEAGEGLPSGGTVGQLLIKQSSTYADAVWSDNPSAPAVHNHDDRYYTETETNTLLAGKANSTHTHTIANTISLQGTLDSKQPTLVSGTNIKTINGNSVLGSGDLVIESGDWQSISATLTYASADSPTFVANTSIDLTSAISVGMKLKLTQTTVKYFIVTAITSTTITLYGGTDYTLANATITLPYFSSMKAPFGFPLDKSKWTIRFEEGTTEFSRSSPTQNTWYNMYSLSIPIGMWEVEWSGLIAVISTASKTGVRVQGTLSTTNNSETDNDLTAYQGISGASGSLVCIASVSRRKVLSLASKTTHYLNIRTTSASADVAAITNSAANQPTIIQAVCAYL